MKVKLLLDKLSRTDPNADVYITFSGDDGKEFKLSPNYIHKTQLFLEIGFDEKIHNTTNINNLLTNLN